MDMPQFRLPRVVGLRQTGKAALLQRMVFTIFPKTTFRARPSYLASQDDDGVNQSKAGH